MKTREFEFLMKAIGLLLLWGCSSKQSTIKSEVVPYKYTIVPGIQKTDSAIVTGTMYRLYNKPLGPVGFIKIGNKIVGKANVEGKYKFSIAPGSYKFTAGGVFYHAVETKKIKLSGGDTLKLDVVLKDDVGPIID
jgi:hypothetical protein